MILIKGMKMPKSCVDCPMFDWDLEYLKCKANDEFFIAKGEWRTKRESTCPLIEVPPHGRLIDADELIEKQKEDAEIFIGSTNYGDKVRYDEAMNAVANIVNAPTVIPADEDGET